MFHYDGITQNMSFVGTSNEIWKKYTFTELIIVSLNEKYQTGPMIGSMSTSLIAVPFGWDTANTTASAICSGFSIASHAFLHSAGGLCRGENSWAAWNCVKRSCCDVIRTRSNVSCAESWFWIGHSSCLMYVQLIRNVSVQKIEICCACYAADSFNPQWTILLEQFLWEFRSEN